MHASLSAAFVPAVVLAALSVACGGSTPEPETPAEDPAEAAALEAERWPDFAQRKTGPSAAREDEDAEGDSEKVSGNGEPAEPEFKDNGSVEEAIAAIPPNAERLNVDHERLAEPLRDPEVYEPCKVGTQHFKMRVAVYDGRAVGIDVEAKNPTLAECIRSEVQKVQWPDKVPSLNTIEFGF